MSAGDAVTILKDDDPEWFHCRIGEHVGLVPLTFFQ